MLMADASSLRALWSVYREGLVVLILMTAMEPQLEGRIIVTSEELYKSLSFSFV